MILSVKYGSSIDRIVASLPKIYKLIEKVYNKSYKIAFLSEEEWKIIRSDYISNKNTKKYVYIDESKVTDSRDFADDESILVSSVAIADSLDTNNIVNSDDIVSEAINLFGENFVEIK